MIDSRIYDEIKKGLECPFCGEGHMIYTKDYSSFQFVAIDRVHCSHCGIEVTLQYQAEPFEMISMSEVNGKDKRYLGNNKPDSPKCNVSLNYEKEYYIQQKQIQELTDELEKWKRALLKVVSNL